MTELAMPALGHWNAIPIALAALLATCTVLLVSWLIYRRAPRNHAKRQPGTPAVRVAALAAVGCTAYSADTSWRFAADYLDMRGTTERTAMFAAANSPSSPRPCWRGRTCTARSKHPACPAS